jgi:hypothetical protein
VSSSAIAPPHWRQTYSGSFHEMPIGAAPLPSSPQAHPGVAAGGTAILTVVGIDRVSRPSEPYPYVRRSEHMKTGAAGFSTKGAADGRGLRPSNPGSESRGSLGHLTPGRRALLETGARRRGTRALRGGDRWLSVTAIAPRGSATLIAPRRRGASAARPPRPADVERVKRAPRRGLLVTV